MKRNQTLLMIKEVASAKCCNVSWQKIERPNDIWWFQKVNRIHNPLMHVYWRRTKQRAEQDGEHVTFILQTNLSLFRDEDLIKPNGIIGPPDGKTLISPDPEQIKNIFKIDPKTMLPHQ